MTVKTGKIAVVGSFAVVAAVAFSPLAAADTADISSIVDTEISSVNSLFDTEAVLSGIPATDVDTAGTFDFVSPSDVTTTELTTLYHFLSGSDQLIASVDPESYEVFNGALANFDDAFNVGLYSLLNGGVLDPDSADFFGSADDIGGALSTDTVSGAVGAFLTQGWDELLLYFGIGTAVVY
jgi:hypothetical protein